MKKMLAAVLCMIMALSCLTAFAEAKTGYAKVAEHITEFHYFFLSQSETVDNPAELCPLLELTGAYEGSVAYSTDSRFFDIVFVSDETGMCVSEIHILAYRSDMESDPDANTKAFAHVIGLLYPFVLDLSNTSDGGDAFIDGMVTGIVESYSQPDGADWEAAGCDYGGICEVTPYTIGDTFGICISFYEPLSEAELTSRNYLMGK